MSSVLRPDGPFSERYLVGVSTDISNGQPEPSESPCCQDKSSPCCDLERGSAEVERNIAGSTDTSQSPCCEGKLSPCCDESCLDRLALRECENEERCNDTSSSHGLASKHCDGRKDGKACEHHTHITQEKFAMSLGGLGCICRILLALGQKSCCMPQKVEKHSMERANSCSSTASRSSVDSCCRSCCSAGQRRSIDSIINVKVKLTDNNPPEPCSGPNDGSVVSLQDDDCCGEDCCAEDQPKEIIEMPKRYVPASPATDLEIGGSGIEHVSLSVSGMTCTGCETKLKRALAQIDSIKHLKTSLVLSRAEFDLDLSIGTLEDVMKRLERATEFKCEKITDQGASIDVITPINAVDLVKQDWPFGVTDIKITSKTSACVRYDPKVVGARDLIERGWAMPLKLAPLLADPTLEAGRKHVRHFGYMTLLSIALTIPVLVLAWAPLPKKDIAYGSVSLALATIVQIVIAGPFYTKALKSLVFSRVIEMDLLIVLSTSAAYIFSIISFAFLASGHPLSTGEFFETSTLLVTLIMVGRYVAALSRQKAVQSISVQSLQTPTALIVDEQGVSEREIDARLLQYGDFLKIIPDSRVPTDGTIISGFSTIDESMITGESKPVEKSMKFSVIAGSINNSGTLIARITRLPNENTISTIANMVDEAKLSKPQIQEIADRVASWFVPVVMVLTIITFAIWIAVGMVVQGRSGAEAAIQAITYAITVLIISCPCSIGLAVPMVIVITSGVAAEHGVVFKSAQSIEVAHKAAHVVFDKTGTLTEGKLTVTAEEYMAEEQAVTVSLLLGLVRSIKHPVSIAVATHLQAKTGIVTNVFDIVSVVGKGVEGRSPSGQVLRAGNSHWLGLSSDPRVISILSRGLSAFCFTVDGSLSAIFGLAEDILRPDAISTITQLRTWGIAVHILSGDDDGPVRAIASKLDVPEDNVRSRCSPAEKAAYIKTLCTAPVESFPMPSASSNAPVVIFCGDGTNDAVALAQASIGIHISSSSASLAEVSRSVATVILLQPRLAGILDIICLSRRATQRITYNFIWSAIYNLFAITLGAGVFSAAGGVKIPPALAGLGELVSVLPVVAAAVALRWERIRK
ncbi:E1-E2 ATPase-domain-containing protein [Lentinula lateritia]|uniref:E1-E2 ATPase-domain-containing protein n=1 Tax=Lentinula lateritia TaxID=40482 RepID=A0ABQ8VKN5_9AGAR|nr:E1-E2 ATPase-domain-containing protein [Lentinula lateritia]